MLLFFQWDTIGQDKFKAVISTCVRDAQGIIFVYDVGKRESFKGIEFWWEFAQSYAPKDTVRILVGNKIDLEADRVVSEAEGEVG
jgi:GTPase SAR1 family protein